MSEQHPLIIVEPAAAPSQAGPGEIEAGLEEALAELRAGGWVTAAHSHVVALARTAARRADQLGPREKAYGVAQVLQATSKVFELLPSPDAVADTQWNDFMDTLQKVGEAR